MAPDTILVATSGRYEFRNKGIDLFINALGEMNRKPDSQRQCVAFILVPAYHKGPRQDLITALNDGKLLEEGDRYLTHGLHYMNEDPTINLIAREKLLNSQTDRVKVIFVPSYLNGDDGIFNMSYYQLLIGLDLTLFPSYYEPWGYTPLESLMFHVPTVTTNLSGFGMWVNSYFKEPGNGCLVVERTDDNEPEVVARMADFLGRFMAMNPEEVVKARDDAWAVSRIANWNTLYHFYTEAYTLALEKSEERRDQPRDYIRILESTDLVASKPHQSAYLD